MKKILIIESRRIVAAALDIRLSAEGYEVRTVHDGAHARATIRKHPPDLILANILMPDGLGFAIREHLLKLNLGGLPIIFMAASKKPGLHKAACELGAAGFFQKPIDPEKLLNCIATSLETSTASTCQSASSPTVSALTPPVVRRQRILVLDDDRNITSALEVRLKTAGYDVWIARNALVALELARNHRPDLLLSDVRMPMGFGCSIIDYLAKAGLPDLPVIFMTASKEKSLRQAAKQLEPAGFLEKPYEPELLLATITDTLKNTPCVACT